MQFVIEDELSKRERSSAELSFDFALLSDECARHDQNE
jgi:hypothetical protein